MRLMKNAVLFIFLLIFIQQSFAQQLTISGKILDINTHRAIPHVNVFIKGTQIGTISDIAGKFTFNIAKPNEQMILVLQHINYDISELALGKIEPSQTFYLQPRINISQSLFGRRVSYELIKLARLITAVFPLCV